jgi:hypothetical protein
LDAAKKRRSEAGAIRRGAVSSAVSKNKHTAELTSDFDDYNIDDDSTAVRKLNNSKNLPLSTRGARPASLIENPVTGSPATRACANGSTQPLRDHVGVTTPPLLLQLALNPRAA